MFLSFTWLSHSHSEKFILHHILSGLILSYPSISYHILSYLSIPHHIISSYLMHLKQNPQVLDEMSQFPSKFKHFWGSIAKTHRFQRWLGRTFQALLAWGDEWIWESGVFCAKALVAPLWYNIQPVYTVYIIFSRCWIDLSCIVFYWHLSVRTPQTRVYVQKCG